MRGYIAPGEEQTIVRVISLSIHSLGELLAPRKGQQMRVSGLQISLAFGTPIFVFILLCCKALI